MEINVAQAIASYRQAEQAGYRRLHQILSNPEARRAIARDGVPILWRQQFVGIAEAEVLRQLEAYLDCIAQHLADETAETDTMETNLAVRVVAALNMKEYEAQEYAVVVVDDQVKGVWDRTTFDDRWFELTNFLTHDRYRADIHVTRYLKQTTVKIQASCSSALWDQSAAKTLAVRAVDKH